MMASRHADSRRSQAWSTAIGSLLVALSTALIATLGFLGATIFALARRIVESPVRVPDTTIVAVDTAAQTITLGRSPDTELPGRYGLITGGNPGYLKIGSVLGSDAATVKRKLLTHLDRTASLTPAASFSGVYFDQPEQLQLPYQDVVVPGPAGECPAWFFPAGVEARTWVIQVHGRGTQRAECLRAVPVFHDVGIASLLVSYRNDGDAPRTRTGSSSLGGIEWHDVDAAIDYALAHGAQKVVLMGWSMGGAIALQTALNTARPDAIAGIVLDSPVIDWRSVLRYLAGVQKVPSRVSGMTLGALGKTWSPYVVRADSPIDFDRFDIVARAGELHHPILILHSDDDGYVPSGPSHALHEARPDLVKMETFDVARHTKLWNYDSARWAGAITDWLGERSLSASPAEGS